MTDQHPPTEPIGPVEPGSVGPVSGERAEAAGSTVQSGIAGPGPDHQHWHMVVAKSADEARQGTAPVLATTGLAIWCIQQYAFHGATPLPVSAAMWTLIPTAIGWLTTHVAFRKVTL